MWIRQKGIEGHFRLRRKEYRYISFIWSGRGFPYIKLQSILKENGELGKIYSFHLVLVIICCKITGIMFSPFLSYS